MPGGEGRREAVRGVQEALEAVLPLQGRLGARDPRPQQDKELGRGLGHWPRLADPVPGQRGVWRARQERAHHKGDEGGHPRVPHSAADVHGAHHPLPADQDHRAGDRAPELLGERRRGVAARPRVQGLCAHARPGRRAAGQVHRQHPRDALGAIAALGPLHTGARVVHDRPAARAHGQGDPRLHGSAAGQLLVGRAGPRGGDREDAAGQGGRPGGGAGPRGERLDAGAQAEQVRPAAWRREAEGGLVSLLGREDLRREDLGGEERGRAPGDQGGRQARPLARGRADQRAEPDADGGRLRHICGRLCGQGRLPSVESELHDGAQAEASVPADDLEQPVHAEGADEGPDQRRPE
mmetsp:Transcript_20877/g.55292  ORF Transcript_20877/g.55292 Transcript_20877/m.55292 type:complete len:352 (+) Transcript_20877:1705-2760(+)